MITLTMQQLKSPSVLCSVCKVERFRVYCSCKMPEEFDVKMISCDQAVSCMVSGTISVCVNLISFQRHGSALPTHGAAVTYIRSYINNIPIAIFSTCHAR